MKIVNLIIAVLLSAVSTTMASTFEQDWEASKKAYAELEYFELKVWAKSASDDDFLPEAHIFRAGENWYHKSDDIHTVLNGREVVTILPYQQQIQYVKVPDWNAGNELTTNAVLDSLMNLTKEIEFIGQANGVNTYKLSFEEGLYHSVTVSFDSNNHLISGIVYDVNSTSSRGVIESFEVRFEYDLTDVEVPVLISDVVNYERGKPTLKEPFNVFSLTVLTTDF